MENGRAEGYLIVKDGKVIREEGVAREVDSGLFRVVLGQHDSGAVNIRSHHVLLKREAGLLVAVYQ